MKKFIPMLSVVFLVCSLMNAFALSVGQPSQETSDNMVIYLESKSELETIEIIPGYMYIWPNEDTENASTGPNIGVSTIKPDSDIPSSGSMTQGVSIPTGVWCVPSEGTYTIEESTMDTVCTEYKFNGANQYWVEMTNNATLELNVKLTTGASDFDNFTVPYNATMGSVYTIPSTTPWYIQFSTTSLDKMDFSGFVKQW